MRKTRKYNSALEILKNFPHNTQDELYKKLNRLGYFWDAKNRQWIRDDRLAEPAMEGLKIRLWASNEEINEYAELIQQLLIENGYRIVDTSEPYPCRPPKQNESRIYLTVIEK